MLLLLLTLSVAVSVHSSPLVILNADNFERLVLNNDGVSVVEFSTPATEHSKAFAPMINQLAAELEGIVVVGALDCSIDENLPLCSKHKITVHPTLKMFSARRQKSVHTGEVTKDSTNYLGKSELKPILAAIGALLTDEHIQRLHSAADLAAFLTPHPVLDLDRALLFSKDQDSSSLYKGVSQQLHAGLTFGEVHESVSEVVEQYGISEFPTLVLLKSNGGSIEYPAGAGWTAVKIKAFLAPYSRVAASRGSGGAAAPPAAGASAAEPAGLARELTVEEADDLNDEEDMHLLAFHGGDAGACPEVVAEFQAAVAVMQDVVKTGVVAVPEAKIAEVTALFGTSSSRLRKKPCALQVVLLPFGKVKSDHPQYSGPLDGKAMQAFACETMPDYTVAVDAASGDFFLAMGETMEKYQARGIERAPSYSSPKVLLFTNKDEVPGVFKALAMNFRDRVGVSFGWVQATAAGNGEFVGRFKPHRIPHVVLMLLTPPPVGQKRHAGGQMALSSQPYMGAIKYNALAAWLTKTTHMLELMTGNAEADAGADGGGEEALIHHVTDEATFKTHCTKSGAGLCVLALLDSAARGGGGTAAHKRSFATMAAMREGQPFSFAWLDVADGGGRLPLLNSLGLLKSDLPAVVLLSHVRLRMAVMPGAPGRSSSGRYEDSDGKADGFDLQKMDEFLESVVGGKAKLLTLQGLPLLAGGPRLVEGGPRGGASQAEPLVEEEEAPVEEEEFDLSDIMSEEVDSAVTGSKTDRLQQIIAEEAKKAAEAEAEKVKAAAAKKTKKKKKSKKKTAKAEL